jgi:uncharacterized phage protein (TIGR02218 family)
VAYNDYEVSVEASRPVELYDFFYQGGHMRYTSADRDITFQSNIYLAAPLDRGRIDDTGEIAQASLQINAAEDFEVSELFTFAPPDDIVSLKVIRFQLGDPDQQSALVWAGRVMTVSWPPDQSQLRCESVLSSLKMTGLRRVYGKGCPHALYGNACKASEVAFTEVATLTTQTGRSLVSSAFDAKPDGWFAGGKITYEPTPGYFIHRGIKTHVGDTVEITHPIRGIPGGAVFKVAPGCSHVLRDDPNGCIEKFSNPENYGGFPDGPVKNPFGSTSVY